MTVPKGGRGKKAPYETQQMRVPLPIKAKVNRLIAEYRGEVLEDIPSELENLKAALAVSQLENVKLNTALQDTFNQIQNLNTDLRKAQEEIYNLNTALEEPKLLPEKISTGLPQAEKVAESLNTSTNIALGTINEKIGEGTALKRFNLERRKRDKKCQLLKRWEIYNP
jgi:septal ring factor EnvC (AmiA/AmiB activator)